MYIPINKDRLDKIDTTGLKEGDTVIFCPKCDFQDVNVAMKPECPKCGASLHIVNYEPEWQNKIK